MKHLLVLIRLIYSCIDDRNIIKRGECCTVRKILIIILALAVTGCTQAPLESQPLPKSQIDAPIKRDVPNAFFSGTKIVEIKEEHRAVENMSWFDSNHVLFLQEDLDGSTLIKHNIYSGTTSEFYEISGWILDVVANVDHSLFALQVINEEDKAEVIIVSKEGNVELTINDFGEDYSVFWNEYDAGSLILTSYLPDWDFETYFVDVENDKMRQIEIEQSYIQWVSKDTVAFLKWDELEPSFEAPLYLVNVNTGDYEVWEDNVIAYISFPDELSLSISVDTDYDLYSSYKFYDQQEVFREIEIPILNTYSEQWGIPYYTYDDKNGIFYFLRPKSSGDFIS